LPPRAEDDPPAPGEFTKGSPPAGTASRDLRECAASEVMIDLLVPLRCCVACFQFVVSEDTG